MQLIQKLKKIVIIFFSALIWLRKRINFGLNRLRIKSIHLFILSPPLCGSTVIQQLLGTSPKVSTLNVEGQWLPEAKLVLGAPVKSWDPQFSVDWKRVLKIFEYYWSPFKLIRVEKSPPHILRAQEIEKAFSNCHLLILIRNPYARIEGAVRREWHPTVESAAKAWVMEAEAQINNIKSLSKRIFFRYEDLVLNPDKVVNEILEFLPDLKSLKPQETFTAHNITDQPIKGFVDLNKRKIKNLTQDQLDRINAILEPNIELLEYFDYKLIKLTSDV
jgi:hypothetical protein